MSGIMDSASRRIAVVLLVLLTLFAGVVSLQHTNAASSDANASLHTRVKLVDSSGNDMNDLDTILSAIQAADELGNPVGTGATAVSTASDAATTLITHPGGGRTLRRLCVDNRGANAAVVSTDGGTTWPIYVAGNQRTEVIPIAATGNIQIKNAGAGSNLSNVYAWAS